MLKFIRKLFFLIAGVGIGVGIALAAILAIPVYASTENPDNYYWNSGQFVGSLILEEGSVYCFLEGETNLNCYHYSNEPYVIYSNQVSDSKFIRFDGCNKDGWITVLGNGTTTMKFELPSKVVSCSSQNNAIFYPIIMTGGE